jgi:hypothetical protein
VLGAGGTISFRYASTVGIAMAKNMIAAIANQLAVLSIQIIINNL